MTKRLQEVLGQAVQKTRSAYILGFGGDKLLSVRMPRQYERISGIVVEEPLPEPDHVVEGRE